MNGGLTINSKDLSMDLRQKEPRLFGRFCNSRIDELPAVQGGA